MGSLVSKLCVVCKAVEMKVGLDCCPRELSNPVLVHGAWVKPAFFQVQVMVQMQKGAVVMAFCWFLCDNLLRTLLSRLAQMISVTLSE